MPCTCICQLLLLRVRGQPPREEPGQGFCSPGQAFACRVALPGCSQWAHGTFTFVLRKQPREGLGTRAMGGVESSPFSLGGSGLPPVSSSLPAAPLCSAQAC